MIQNAKKEELEEAFLEFEPDGGTIDGTFGKKALRKILEKHGEKMEESEFEKLFAETDYDGDKRIGFEDFVRMMMSRGTDDKTNTS